MKKNTLNKFAFFFLSFLVLQGCKAKRPLAAQLPPEKPIVISEPLVVAIAPPAGTLRASLTDSVLSKELNFNTLNLRAKGKLDIDGKDNDVTLNIRIKKDQAIWISVTAIAGLTEIARLLVTPDSIKLLNRPAKEFLDQPFSYLHDFTNKELKFGTLQSLLIGNIIPGIPDNSTITGKNNGQTTLSGTMNQVAYALLVNAGYKIVQTDLKDPGTNQSLSLSYADFVPLNGSDLANSVILHSFSGKNKITLDLKYSKIGINEPVEMPFTVPKRFNVVR